MFHWICPECGQEIAPGVKECPVCELQASAASLPFPDHPTSAAVAPEALPTPVAVLPASPIQQPTPAPRKEVQQPAIMEQSVPEPKAILQPEVILPPELVLQPKEFFGPHPPVVLDAMPTEAPEIVMPDVPKGPATPIEPQPETFADRLADLASLLHGERVPYTAPRIFQESAAPRPRVEADAEKKPVILDVTFQAEIALEGPPARPLLAAPPSRLLLAEPQPPIAPQELLNEAFKTRPAEYAFKSRAPMGAEPAAGSPVRLPEAPNRTTAPALAPLKSYSRAADRLMRPAEFDTPMASSEGLPKITLPGPALPRELMSLQAAGLVPIRSGGRRWEPRGRFGPATKFAVVGILLTASVATYSMMPGSSAGAPPKPVAEPAPEPPVSTRSVSSGNSLARFVEVTGVRFMEVNKKPQIHYLVVNHSSAPLSSLTVYVTLRSATAKAGQAPIARLSFRSPALDAFEAKEMFSSIERATSPLDLPDWQDLRADVEVQ